MKTLVHFVFGSLSVFALAGCCGLQHGKVTRSEEKMIRQFSNRLLKVIQNKDEADYAAVIPNAGDWFYNRNTKTFYPQPRPFDPEIPHELLGKFRSVVNQLEVQCGDMSKVELVQSWYVLSNHPWINEAGLFQFDLYYEFQAGDKTITIEQNKCIQFRRGILVANSLRVIAERNLLNAVKLEGAPR